MSERILVTGGAGFVGSTIALKLKQSNPSRAVVVLDNLRRRGSELAISRLAAHGIEFVHGDIRNAEDLEAVGPVSWLVECSAEPSVHAGVGGDPSYLVNTNLFGAVSCLEHVRRHGGDLIFLSSSRIYPIAPLRALPLQVADEQRFVLADGAAGPGWSSRGIDEQFPLAGARSLYGATKLAAELLIEEYVSLYGVRAVVNRCGVICGPWQLGKVDQGFVALWVARHVYGGSLDYMGFGGKGHQVRDLLHVDDLVSLVERQMQDIGTYSGAVYNVGGGHERSVSLCELTRLCEAITGRRIEIGAHPETGSVDIPYFVTDTSAITEATGWRPSSSVEQIVEDTYQWVTEHRAELAPIFGA